MIKKINYYTNEKGFHITEEAPLDGSDSKFIGHANIKINMPNQEIERPIVFSIPNVKTVEEAFENFEKARSEEGPKEAQKMISAMNERIKEAQEKRRSQIIVPNANVNVPIPPESRG